MARAIPFPAGDTQLLSSVFFFGGVSAPRDGETEKRLDLQQVQTYFWQALMPDAA